MRVGITGHSNLTAESVPMIADGIRAVLADVPAPVTGVSCLARGADQVFAAVVLDLGHRLDVVLPAADYRERKVKPHNRDQFERLISRAAQVDTLPFETSNRAAYEAANEHVLGLLPFPWVPSHDRPGRLGQQPPRVRVAMAMSASGLW